MGAPGLKVTKRHYQRQGDERTEGNNWVSFLLTCHKVLAASVYIAELRMSSKNNMYGYLYMVRHVVRPCLVPQFFARGAFALPMVTGYQGPQPGFLGALRTQAWAVRALALSGLDWPIRRLSSGAPPFVTI